MHYAKADRDDLLMTVEVTNAGPEADVLHVLPTAWFRNTWSWERDAAPEPMAATGPTTRRHPAPVPGRAGAGRRPRTRRHAARAAVLRQRDQPRRLYGQPGPQYPKDGINDHVVAGAPTVNPDRRGSKCAAWYRVPVAPGETVELRLRLRPAGSRRPTAGRISSRSRDRRRAEADEFYAELTPAAASEDEARVMRQAFAGMLWSKQLYYYDVRRWLDGDPGQPVAARLPAHGPQRPVALVQRLRHHVDARQVGVPLVRGLGPGVPLRRAGARRSRVSPSTS